MRVSSLVAVMLMAGTAGCWALFNLDDYGPPPSAAAVPDASPDGDAPLDEDATSPIQIPVEIETQQLRDAFAVKVDDLRLAIIDSTIVDLKQAGLWDKLGLVYVLTAHDEQAARLNWKDPAIGQLQAAGGTGVFPPFTPDVGYTGDGVSALSTQTPIGQIAGYSDADGHAAVWVLDDAALAEGDDLGLSNAGGSGEVRIQSRLQPNQLLTQLNDRTIALVPVTSSVGYVVISRASISSYSRYKDGVSLGDAQSRSTGVPSGNARILSHAASRSTRTVALAHWGASLTAEEVSAAHAIFSRYLTAVRVPR